MGFKRIYLVLMALMVLFLSYFKANFNAAKRDAEGYRKPFAKKYGLNEEGITVNTVIVLMVVFILCAYVLPDAITAMISVNMTLWDAKTQAMWGLITFFGVLGLALGALAMGLKMYKGNK